MDPEKSENFRLKAVMLELADLLVVRIGGDIGNYIIAREDLQGETWQGQNQLLQMQIATLTRMLDRKAR